MNFMKHQMKLNREPFEQMKSGIKTIELRLYDEKRSLIKIGDEIEFFHKGSGESLVADVVALHRFKSFKDLYETLPLCQCGYTAENVDQASPSDMNRYYSAELQGEYDVIGIELRLK